VTEEFAAEWLALREPFDRAARSVEIARRLADRLPRRPRLVDLGGGTGSMFRFLAPIIGRGQDWILVDADDALLEDAFGRTAAWARRQGFGATAEGDELSVSTPRGLWRMQAVARDLSAPSTVLATAPPPSSLSPSQSASSPTSSFPPSWPGLARPSTSFDRAPRLDVDGRAKPGHDEKEAPRHDEVHRLGADAVVCSALLDLVSTAWLARVCDTLTVPFLACLTADGRDAWRPRHPHDALVRTAFRRDMRRDKGFGPALGTAAPNVLTVRGRATASAPSDWRIPRTALRMQRALIDGTADAARNARPAHADAITVWQEARLRQALRGRLAITIGHRDILFLPPGG
jgi:hypothetical protein